MSELRVGKELPGQLIFVNFSKVSDDAQSKGRIAKPDVFFEVGQFTIC